MRTPPDDNAARLGLWLRRAFEAIRSLVGLDVGEQRRLLWFLVRWSALGTVVGVLAGASSAGFLASLEWATDTRTDHGWLLFGLPLAGFVVGLAYHYGGGRSGGGNNLLLDEIHEPTAWVPRRLAPLVYAGTVATHLFGGSAGREGTAIQMSGSLTDGFNRLARLGAVDRRVLLIAAISGGFGAVFGVPVAGFVFGLEVQSVGRVRYDAIVPAFVASLVGDAVVGTLGVDHAVTPTYAAVDIDPALVGKVAVAGVVFGVAALVFTELTHGLKALFARTVRWSPARPLVGGVLVIAMTGAIGSRDYLGLSLPLIADALAGGAGIAAFGFLVKLVFTAVTLGSGFQGGEVTPLFVIGATLGVSMARLLDAPVPLFAAIGFVAVFAGATNTPLACTIMGVELFGAGPIALFATACVVSYVVSGDRGIYQNQRVDVAKGVGLPGETLGEIATRRRRRWRSSPNPNAENS